MGRVCPTRPPALVLPKNWPAHITYLRIPNYSKHLTDEQLDVLRQPPADESSTIVAANIARGPSLTVRITAITDAAHPANGEAGLFAVRDLKPGQLIVQYVGELHSTSSASDVASHALSDYDLWIDKDAGLAVDARRAGNEARFVNDYRGVADRPNAEFREIWDASRRERGIAVFVLPEAKAKKGSRKTSSGIKKGAEILVSYGKGFWASRS